MLLHALELGLEALELKCSTNEVTLCRFGFAFWGVIFSHTAPFKNMLRTVTVHDITCGASARPAGNKDQVCYREENQQH